MSKSNMYSERMGNLDYIAMQVCLTLLKIDDLESSQVLREIQKQTGVDPQYLLSEVQTAALARLRWAASFVYKGKFRLSFPEIGRQLGGRDHSTIIHGYRKMGELLGYTKEELRRIANYSPQDRKGKELAPKSGEVSLEERVSPIVVAEEPMVKIPVPSIDIERLYLGSIALVYSSLH